jgi:hypothetical protein
LGFKKGSSRSTSVALISSSFTKLLTL